MRSGHQQQFNLGTPEDPQFKHELNELIVRIGTTWIAWCKRQIIDGDGNHQWVLEGWIWIPARGEWEFRHRYNLAFGRL